MGYAKYKEDIEKIYSQNIFGTFLDAVVQPVPHYQCPFCSLATQSKPDLEQHIVSLHRDAAIYLEHDDRIVPERAVFKVRPVQLKVRCLALSNGITVAVTQPGMPRAEFHFTDGQLLKLSPPDEEADLVELGIGAFTRQYAISFKHTVRVARLTEHLLREVQQANSTIATWQWADVMRFEATLRSESELTSDEVQHRHAIYEYYLALWQEQNQTGGFTKQFEEAFNILREFQDPLAQIITGYFLYRVNYFHKIFPFVPFRLLRAVKDFFAEPFGHKTPDSMPKTKLDDAQRLHCEITISDADDAIFSATIALLAGDYSKARLQCETATSRIPALDEQAGLRLAFLLYRLHRMEGNIRESRFHAEKLARCPIPKNFRSEAEAFLEETKNHEAVNPSKF